MAALPGLSFMRASRVTLSSTAVTMVAPGGAAPGMATSFAMLRWWGFEGRPVGLAVAVTGIWNQLVILGVPILAVAGLVAEGDRNRTIEWVALVALAAFCVIVAGFAVGLSSPRLARRVGDRAARIASWCKRLVHKAPVKWNGEGFVRFRAEAIVLIRSRWWYLTLATLANHLSVFLVLLLSLARRRRDAGGRDGRGGVRSVGAFAGALLDRDHPGRRRLRRARADRSARRLRRDERGSCRSDARLPLLTIVPTLALGLVAAATFKVGRPPERQVPDAV